MTITRSGGRRAATALALLALYPQSASAAGFALFEQGAKGMGFAGAFTAQANDPSAIFHNPAGLAFQKGKQLYLGATAVNPRSDFTGSDPFPGTAITEKGDAGVLLPPNAYYTQRLGEGLAVGLGLHVPYGLKSAWKDPDTYSGRYISTLAELKGFSLNPTVAFKLRDRLAVGAGVDVRFSKVLLERRVPVVNPFTVQVVDGALVHLESDYATGVGFNVGVLAKPSEAISVGASYRHKVRVDYSGTADFTPRPTGNSQLDTRVTALLPSGQQPIETSIEFPGFFSVGVAWSRHDWTVEGDFNWYQWNTFDRLPLTFTGRPDLSQTIVENYENSYQYRLGVERVLNDRYAVRAGYFFDQSPAPSSSISPLLPDADRNGFALGGTYRAGNWRVDAGTWFILSDKRSTEGTNRDDYNGTYESKAFTLGLSLGYTF
ncbi:MAG TPA: outer membrane protein transport protein [Vicinamibacteria bacterium]